ncbi:hypothetical protein [Alkalibacterium olivapovliticus]|uniref:DUF3139 domain-containing protein n=1 Tax=Alkalibacterium olivapovliticus TaxID=99907 RepID=A0A2T0W9D6_9LACT|nr:hypothetical protein [Alkalibacterium olivapovliticus]PRY83320.1 hypothetical protein CLV38_105101 [Alkalibacterium olivapovliticus]
MSPLRKKIVLGLIITFVLVMSAYAFNAHLQKRALETDTLAYLESEGVNTETAIENSYIGNGAGRQDFYVMYITLEDTPTTTHLFTYRENTQDIFLFDTIESQAK